MACKECRNSNNTEGIPYTNALICYDKSHAGLSRAEMLKILPHVFPGFDDASYEALVLAWTDHLPMESTAQTYFDTVTGERKVVIPGRKISDPHCTLCKDCSLDR